MDVIALFLHLLLVQNPDPRAIGRPQPAWTIEQLARVQADEQARRKAAEREQERLLTEFHDRYVELVRHYLELGERMDAFVRTYNAGKGQTFPLAEARRIEREIEQLNKAYASLAKSPAWIQPAKK